MELFFTIFQNITLVFAIFTLLCLATDWNFKRKYTRPILNVYTIWFVCYCILYIVNNMSFSMTVTPV